MKYGSRYLRHELKYLINYSDYYSLRSSLAALLSPDENTTDPDGYMIRSLYFDSIGDNAYFDKESGVEERRKHRIRIYGLSSEVIKYEMKDKFGSYISKLSAPITQNECVSIINRRCDFMLDSESPVLRSAYIDMRLKLLRPRVIVDYTREAYVCSEGNVRITFDKNLEAGLDSFDIFDPEIVTVPAIAPGTMILEVKYDDFLPSAIKRALRNVERMPLALSKYVMCRKAKEIYFRKEVPYEYSGYDRPVKLHGDF